MSDGTDPLPHLIQAPQVAVAGRAIERETERLLREWKVVAPDAYAHWEGYCNARKRTMRQKGLSKSGEFMTLAVTPDWIYYGIGRFLKNPSWPTEVKGALEAVWRAMPCNRMNGNSSGTCAADHSRK